MTQTSAVPGATPGRWFVVGLVLWFVAAVVAAGAGVLARLPFPPPALIGVLTTALLVALWQLPELRRWVLGLDLRILVGVHLVRVVGAYFLVLQGRGLLPGAFAQPAGWGDLAVAALAVPVLLWALPVRSRGRWRALFAWNAVGLLDILVAVGTAARVILTEDDFFARLPGLPLGLLPTFVVPLIIVTHVMLFVRLAQLRNPARAPESVAAAG
jgi:hypothetical protein